MVVVVLLLLVALTISLLACLLHVDSVTGSVPRHNITLHSCTHVIPSSMGWFCSKGERESSSSHSSQIALLQWTRLVVVL